MRLLEFLRRLNGSFRRGRTDEDVQEELRAHLELAADREGAAGHAPADASRRARLRAGTVSQAMGPVRDQRSLPWLDSLRSDIVFGWRQIARHRVASLAAILSLGLAMGAALAALRLVDAVLLRPLPVSDPSRLFVVTTTSLNLDQVLQEREDFDYPTFRKYIDRVGPQADLMLVGFAHRRNVAFGGGDPETVVEQFVSGNVFPALGLKPAAGRLLDGSDDTIPGGHPVAVITRDYWQRRFAADPAVVGRTYRAGKELFTVVGVVDGRFTGTEPGTITDVFVPSMMNPDALNAKGWNWFRIWARPRAGVDRLAVQAILQAGFRADHVEGVKGFPPDTPKARLDAYFKEELRLQPASAGASAAQRTFREPLWILSALAALLVLMACANVANLLLARAMTRRVEMALRLSIGAARRRLVQMMLVESLVLALVAAAAGALFASWAAPFVVSMLAPPEQPLRVILDLDWRTMLTAASLTIAVTMLFGLLPALRASATPLLEALKEVRGRHGHRRLAGVLVGAQAAFCVFLLFGASLFLGTLDRLQHRPLGFAPDHLLHIVVEGTRDRSPENWAQLAAALRNVPRVESAAVAGWAPLTGNRWRSSVTRPGFAPPEDAPDWMAVAPGYIETMKMRLVEGRDFRAGDRAPRKENGQPAPGVAIVNETFARIYFGGKSPIGQRVTVDSSQAPMEIVGMTADAVYASVREAGHPAVLIPLEGVRQGGTVLVRTSIPGPDITRAVREAIVRFDPALQIREAVPFQSIVTKQIVRERLLGALSAFFATLGLVLAIIGLYSVLNYAVTRERHEIGLRLALGARPGHIVAKLTTRLGAMVAIGAVAGIGLGLGFGQYVQKLLFQVAPTDLRSVGPPIVALGIAAVLAVLPPAIRAVRTDPAQTIKSEG
ncbi:MAG TPA: ADOP family duplicated permease [Vicinamibacterales bacterium]|nr:ADOP family duplicated permease [Vicinamibacterales bacterium]